MWMTTVTATDTVYVVSRNPCRLLSTYLDKVLRCARQGEKTGKKGGGELRPRPVGGSRAPFLTGSLIWNVLRKHAPWVADRQARRGGHGQGATCAGSTTTMRLQSLLFVGRRCLPGICRAGSPARRLTFLEGSGAGSRSPASEHKRPRTSARCTPAGASDRVGELPTRFEDDGWRRGCIGRTLLLWRLRRRCRRTSARGAVSLRRQSDSSHETRTTRRRRRAAFNHG